MFCLTPFAIASNAYRRKINRGVINELEGMWQEVLMARLQSWY